MSPEYQGTNLEASEQAFMVELEKVVGNPIPFMDPVNYGESLGFSAKGGHVTILFVKSQGIAQLPPNIDRLSKLETLHLNSNQLTEIPSGIEKLSGLQHLELGFNQIKDLPPSIVNLKVKTYLGLMNNPLSKMSKDIDKWVKNLEKKGCGVFL
jgi:Leucine-rich repeat (LRR) protein